MSTPRRIGLLTRSCPSYVQLAFDTMAAGHVVVPVRSKDDHERLTAAGVEEVLEPSAGFGWFHGRWTPQHGDELAYLSFTSGTEGKPKGVELSHRALSDVSARLNEVMAVDSSIREYVGVPVHLSFGFGRCRAVAEAGGATYIPERGFDVIEVRDLLQRGEINAVSAVPSLWRAVLDDAEVFKDCAERLKWVEIGSQYMSGEEKAALKRLFPAARIVQHYGLTEASRSTFLIVSEAPAEHLNSVGRAVGATEIGISEHGCVLIRGSHVASAVIVDGERTSPVDAEGWYRTSDRGKLVDGYLYYEGRADDVINCGGIKLSPEQLEASMREKTGLSTGFAVCRVPDRMRGDGILLAVESVRVADRPLLVEALLEAVGALGVNARGAVRVVELAELPRTNSGKVKRGEIGKAGVGELVLDRPAHGESADAAAADAPRTEEERRLAAIWEQALGVSPIRVSESFYDLGGDSVTALSVVVRMSRTGLPLETCRRIFQGATIRELAQSAHAKPDEGGVAPARGLAHGDYLNTLMVNAVRGVLVLAVISGHWSEGAFQRLPSSLSWIAHACSPFFSFGTPGFAIVFGMGFGYIYFHRLPGQRDRVWAAARLGALLVGSGVLLLGTLMMLTSHRPVESASFFVHFYSGLTFYLLALPTLPLWGLLVHRVTQERFVPVLLGLAALSYSISLGLDEAFGPWEADGFLRLVRLMLVAKFNYFEMMAGVLAGVASGVYVRSSIKDVGRARKVLVAGSGATGIALLVGAALGELGTLFTWPTPLSPWRWTMFYGFVLLLLGGLLGLVDGYDRRARWLRKGIEGVATVGQLALPFYVLHEMVIPLKALVVRGGIPDAAAVVLAVTIFAGTAFVMLRRVGQLFHSS